MKTKKHKAPHPVIQGSFFLEKVIRLLIITAIACLFIPLNPAPPLKGLDNSWEPGTNQATSQHLALGRNVICKNGKLKLIKTREVERPDFGADFNTPSLNKASYTSAEGVSGLYGEYILSLELKSSD
ncbi:hypothetical protein D3C77_236330 [compost metagenome]